MRFGDWLRRIQVSLGVDQQGLADALGLSTRMTMVTWMKSGDLPPLRADSREKLVYGLGYETIDDLSAAFKGGTFPDPDWLRLRLNLKPMIANGTGLVGYHPDMTVGQIEELRKLTPDQQRAAFGKAWSLLSDDGRRAAIAAAIHSTPKPSPAQPPRKPASRPH